MKTPPKVLIAAGGTGGHLIPAQQLGKLLSQHTECQVAFAGYNLRKSPYFRKNEFRFFEILSAPKSTARLSLFKTLIKGFFQAIRVLWKEKPDVVVGFGSYHSAPVLLASALLGKKILLYEANRTMGKVNRWISLFAKAIGYQFPLMGFQSPKLVSVQWFPWTQANSANCSRSDALADFGLNNEYFTVLVFGGSQGAMFLNQIAPDVLKRLKRAQAIHLAGTNEGAQLAMERYEKENIPAKVLVFEENMEKAYAAADFALCRSGAGTVAELIRFSVPSMLVPYPYAAENHQQQNAKYLSDLGGALICPQTEAKAESMATQIEGADRERMKEALKRAAKGNESSIQFYQLVARYAGKNTRS